MAALVSQAGFAQTPESELRTWTSKDGKFSTAASFISFADGTVRLKTGDGRELNVPIDRLSLADHEYVSSVGKWGRVWRNAAGKELYVGKFESIDGEKVRITTITGRKLRVNLSRLDLDSREHVLRQRREPTIGPSTPEAAPDTGSTIAAPPGTAASEEAIRRLIADCAANSRRMRIDGSAVDWNNLPTYVSGARIDDGSRDIVRVGIAPRESDLLVMIETRTRPAREDFSFFVRVDFLGQHESDFQIGLSSSSWQRIKVYDELTNSRVIAEQNLGGLTVQVGEVVEVRIPYAAVASVLPSEMGALLFGERVRPFVRVETMSYDQRSRSITDYGPSVASFRFSTNEYPLDDAAPGDRRPVLPVSVPFDGKWFVGNGAMGLRAHQGVHAYDFYIMDHQLQPAKVRRSTDNRDYYSWGRPALNPIEGKVIRVESEHPDGTPSEQYRKPANMVNLTLSGRDDLVLRLLHFQQNGIKVQPGQNLRKGDVVGLVGNSGFSGWAHLHIDLMEQKARGKSATVPIAFDKAIVSLNPIPDDPWTRYVENWEIRAGVFVEQPRTPNAVGP
jgi:hypothetical protein